MSNSTIQKSKILKRAYDLLGEIPVSEEKLLEVLNVRKDIRKIRKKK